jgi:hypothetical protein
MVILGIDTDSRGSVAVLDTSHMTLDVFPLPTESVKLTTGRTALGLHSPALAALLGDLTSRANVVILEKQWARPEQGVSSTFGFGKTYGQIIGCVSSGLSRKGYSIEQIEKCITYVSGADWKSALKLSKDKKLAREMASALFPLCSTAWKLAKHTSAAEASLIAFYGTFVHGIKLQKGVQIRPNDIVYTNNARSLINGKV